ncbi:sensor histidine kinase [Frankia nepalensis]|uniref:sensor histidine kinase n=1 Tax=Frankia nepalensis TaxID=1836974 RepID=UPI0027DE42AC|nr:sensor domain-containing protein [Frankia nepalensis]
MVISLPLAVVEFLFAAVSLLLGAALSVTFLGLPLLAASGRAVRALGTGHRRLAGALLGERVAPPAPFQPGRGLFGWLQSALADAASWRARAYLALKLPLAVLGCYLVAACWVQGLLCLTYPVWWSLSEPGQAADHTLLHLDSWIFRAGSPPAGPLDHRLAMRVGEHCLDSWPAALVVSLGGLLALLAVPWVVRALTWADLATIRGLLGPTTASRVRLLETARAQVVDDAASTLRRIERDLHDGTQARLATLAMTLGQAKEKLEHRPGVPFDPPGALALVDTAHRQAKEALEEVRDIARGIHPPALDVGLDAALATLVARSAVPAVFESDLPDRPSRAIETIAYFSAAELLANVARHSRAAHAAVSVSSRGGRLVLRVHDDGVGSARLGGGSGLSGLAERARAVDGRLELTSPPGGPTEVTVHLPLHA